MTGPKEKPKPSVPTRTPGKKTPPGIFDNLRQLPHPVDEFLNPTRPIPAQPDPTRPIPTQPVAPARDYNKRANSLERDALPAGRFPGTSKKLYDALYMRTRGAVVPARVIQATKRELMAWSGIRSKNTVAVNLQLLTANGLIRKQLEIGDHGGSVYEVFLPEEATQPNPTQPSPTHPDPTRKLGGDPTQKLGWDGTGKTVDFQRTSDEPKTSFKTKEQNTDDELRPLRDLERELTGKNSSWEEVVSILVTELKIAAARTDSISSVPAFLAEHLRRRLFKKDKAKLESDENAAPAPATPQIDASQCPDCGGSNYFYPDGFDKGVSRCRHERLK